MNPNNQQSVAANILKAFGQDTDIIKAEGSRGGKVTGHTKSGKAIYSKMGTKMYHSSAGDSADTKKFFNQYLGSKRYVAHEDNNEDIGEHVDKLTKEGKKLGNHYDEGTETTHDAYLHEGKNKIHSYTGSNSAQSSIHTITRGDKD